MRKSTYCQKVNQAQLRWASPAKMPMPVSQFGALALLLPCPVKFRPTAVQSLNRPTPRHFRRTDDDPPSPTSPTARPPSSPASERRRSREQANPSVRLLHPVLRPLRRWGQALALLAGAALLLPGQRRAVPGGSTTVSPPAAPTSSPMPRAGLASRAPCSPPARSSRCIAAAPTPPPTFA